MRQGFNRDGIGERELSEQLYGPEQLGMPVELDESVFEIRLGRFLGVTDFRHQLWDKFNRPPTHQVVPPMEF